MNVMSDALEIRGLKVEFRSMRGVVKALNGVDLSVGAREIVGLVGESGCGKTITGFSILGLLPRPQARITEGHILVSGESVLDKTEAEFRQVRGKAVSMVFQDPLASLNPLFSIGEQIERVVRVHTGKTRKAARQAAKEALAATGLPTTTSIFNSYPHQLSGGMRQRACMAMAISCGSALLIADEPTTALDVTIQMQILRLLLRLRDKLGVAQVLITHNVGVAAQACDRMAVMYAGSVVEQGPTADVAKRARHPYTIGLYECLPQGKRARTLRTIRGSVPDLIDPPPGCRFHPRCERATDICAVRKPSATAVSRDHWVSCHWVADQLATDKETVAAR